MPCAFPLRATLSLPLGISHRRTLPSAKPAARSLLSGAKARAKTPFFGPLRFSSSLPVVLQRRTVPSAVPHATSWPLPATATDRTDSFPHLKEAVVFSFSTSQTDTASVEA